MPAEARQSPTRIALLLDFTPGLLERMLRKTAKQEGLNIEITGLNPANWQAAILAPDSPLHTFHPEIILVGLSGPVQWERFAARKSFEEQASFAEFLQEEMRGIHQALKTRHPKAEIWQSNLGPFLEGSEGLETEPYPSFAEQRALFNASLIAHRAKDKTLRIVDWDNPVAEAGMANAYDPRLWLTAAHPFAPGFLPVLGEPIIAQLRRHAGSFLKVIALDLDDTLWGGVIGDAGPEGISIGPEGIGNLYWHFQSWVKQLKDRGFLLVVASRNETAVARAAFTENRNHLLSLADFAVFKASWSPKSEMLEEISRELNIGLQAFCFLDNSPFERNEVRSRLPEVIVPELPADPAEWIPFLARSPLFRAGPRSRTNATRTQMLQQAGKRSAQQAAFPDYASYLQSLQMRGRIAPLSPKLVPRAHELILRTNQFNLRTIRHSAAFLQEVTQSEDWIASLFGLRDNFGDYGSIGLILIRLNHPNPGEAFIDTWVMSCRVFERGLENWIFNHIVEELKNLNMHTLIGEFIPSPKNQKFADLYKTLGFDHQAGQVWRLRLDSATRQPTLIENEKK